MRISDWSSDVCSSDLDPNDCDLEQMMVLEHSLRQHASLPVDINWMQLSSDPQSFWYSDSGIPAGWHTERWATPFSGFRWAVPARSEEHTSELQSLMRISYAVFCLKKKTQITNIGIYARQITLMKYKR